MSELLGLASSPGSPPLTLKINIKINLYISLDEMTNFSPQEMHIKMLKHGLFLLKAFKNAF